MNSFAFLSVHVTGLGITEHLALAPLSLKLVSHNWITPPSSSSNNLASAAKLEFLFIRVYGFINLWDF